MNIISSFCRLGRQELRWLYQTGSGRVDSSRKIKPHSKYSYCSVISYLLRLHLINDLEISAYDKI